MKNTPGIGRKNCRDKGGGLVRILTVIVWSPAFTRRLASRTPDRLQAGLHTSTPAVAAKGKILAERWEGQKYQDSRRLFFCLFIFLPPSRPALNRGIPRNGGKPLQFTENCQRIPHSSAFFRIFPGWRAGRGRVFGVCRAECRTAANQSHYYGRIKLKRQNHS
jgi:hypothetical protein